MSLEPKATFGTSGYQTTSPVAVKNNALEGLCGHWLEGNLGHEEW